MRVGLVAVMALACGCSQLYALDTTVLDDDLDADGISDERDNCLRVPNADQHDSDGDGVGDACGLICLAGARTGKDSDRDRFDDGCDPCLLGPQLDASGTPLDEDGDTVPDACDNCPGLPNPDQANDDADDIGDLCDFSKGTFGVRLLFDAFATVRDVWTGKEAWTSAGGTAVTTTGGSLALPTLQLVGSDAATWYAQVGIVLPADPPASYWVGVSFSAGDACAVTFNGTSFEVVARNAGGATASAPVPDGTSVARLVASFIPLALNKTRINCFVGDAYATLIDPAILDVQTPVFTAQTAATLSYIDVAN